MIIIIKWLWLWTYVFVCGILALLLCKTLFQVFSLKNKLPNCKVFHSRKVLNYLLPANFFRCVFFLFFFLLYRQWFFFSVVALIKWLRCCFFLCWIFVIFSFPVVFSTSEKKSSVRILHSFNFGLLPGLTNVESFVLCAFEYREKKRG